MLKWKARYCSRNAKLQDREFGVEKNMWNILVRWWQRKVGDSMFNDISLWRFTLNRYLGFRYEYFGLQILNQAIVSGARHNSSHLQNAILKVRPKTTYLFAFWLRADQNLTFKMYLTPLSFDVIVAV